MAADIAREVEVGSKEAARTTKYSYPGPSHPDGKWGWYPLFVHARNLPEILVNRELSLYIRALITSCSVMSPLTVSCHEFITGKQRRTCSACFAR